VEVAVRPSTGLKLRETANTVYRVLQFSSYTDTNGPYEVSITNASPAVLKVLATVTTIATNVCTTSQNHKLRIGDKFIPTSTANNFVIGTTYYVISVPEYNQFTVSLSPGGSTFALVDGAGLIIKGSKTHKLIENYTLEFTTTGTLPSGLAIATTYFVISSGLTDTEFQLALTKNGSAINTSSAGSGVHSYDMVGLTKTNLRENYDYIDLTLWQPGEYISAAPTGTEVSGITFPASPAVISTTSAHGFSAGDVVVLYNNHSAAIPVTLSTTNAYIAGTNTNKSSVSLATRGVCNILFVSATVAILTGNIT
jgi:hypothetical protein